MCHCFFQNWQIYSSRQNWHIYLQLFLEVGLLSDKVRFVFLQSLVLLEPYRPRIIFFLLLKQIFGFVANVINSLSLFARFVMSIFFIFFNVICGLQIFFRWILIYRNGTIFILSILSLLFFKLLFNLRLNCLGSGENSLPNDLAIIFPDELESLQHVQGVVNSSLDIFKVHLLLFLLVDLLDLERNLISSGRLAVFNQFFDLLRKKNKLLLVRRPILCLLRLCVIVIIWITMSRWCFNIRIITMDVGNIMDFLPGLVVITDGSTAHLSVNHQLMISLLALHNVWFYGFVHIWSRSIFQFLKYN